MDGPHVARSKFEIESRAQVVSVEKKGRNYLEGKNELQSLPRHRHSSTHKSIYLYIIIYCQTTGRSVESFFGRPRRDRLGPNMRRSQRQRYLIQNSSLVYMPPRRVPISVYCA